MHFHSAVASFEPQNYVVVEQFEAESIPLVSGRHFYKIEQSTS